MNRDERAIAKRWSIPVYAVTILALALSALSPLTQAQDKQQTPKRPAYSGFLGDYSQLKPVPDREGLMAYVSPKAKAVRYTKIFFQPVDVYVAPSAEYKGVQPDALKRMTDSFVASFKKALTPGYEIVDAPGPDVLQVRCAITGVQPVKPGLTPVDFLPIKAVFNAGRAAAGKSPQVAELTAEMELLDNDKNRIAAVVANRKGDKTLQQGDQITWEHLQAITDYWAKNFRQRLDESRVSGG
jgi:uncharacterized protein DUF3313